MAAVVLCFSVIYPAREAKAFFPVLPVVMMLVDAAGAVLASDLLTAAGLQVLGGIAVAAIFSIPGDSSSVSVAVPLTADPSNTEVAMPAPAAPATVPLSSSGGSQFRFACAWGTGVGATAEAACIASGVTSGGYGAGRCYYCSGYCTNVPNDCDGAWESAPASCPDGYEVSGSSCVLTDPRQAVSDKRVDLYPCGSGLCFDPPKDKDVKPANASVSDGCNGCGKIWGKNSKGEPFVTTITPSANGGSVIQTATQATTSSGSIVRTETIVVNGAGTVVSANGTTNVGSITDSGTVTVAPTVTTNTTANTPIVFPDDYARQGTLSQEVANTKAIANALTTSATGVVDPAIPGASQFDDAFFKTTFNSLLSWSPPAHSSACPTSSFDALGKTFTINAHCALVDNNFAGIRQAMAVVYVLLAMFIVLRA